MIIKNYQFNINLEIIKKYRAVLLYGANEGVKIDFVEKVKDQNKQSEIYSFFEEEILKNNQFFFEIYLTNHYLKKAK